MEFHRGRKRKKNRRKRRKKKKGKCLKQGKEESLAANKEPKKEQIR